MNRSGKECWAGVAQYYQNLYTRPGEKYQQILENCRAAGFAPLWISPALGRFLELLVRSLGAKRVLEIGTQGGYSTAWLGGGLPADGILISLEIIPEQARLARENLARLPFGNQIEIQVGDALDLMAGMERAGIDPFDFVFIDAEKSLYCEFLEAAIQVSRAGTVIIADNVVKHGEVVNPAILTSSQVGITKFHHLVANHPRLHATVLQTVDEKGHDGICYLIVDPGEG